MRYAILDGIKYSEPKPGARATCPGCGADLIAKCGFINEWHWAHISADCDSWSDGETEWHINWKKFFPPQCCEVVMGPHRADVKIGNEVIEFQSSPISVEEIRERERFYGSMTWVFDAEEAYESGRLSLRTQHKRTSKDFLVMTFRWKHARKSIAYCQQGIVLDIGKNSLFSVQKIHWGKYFSGWGILLSKAELVRQAMSQGGAA